MFFLDAKSSTIKKLCSKGKGILAADESVQSIGKRFTALGIENSENNRRTYRELLFTAPGIEKYISGVILFDETIHQTTTDGKPFTKVLVEKGIFIGIKVDTGLVPFADSDVEKITEGLEGLAKRLDVYYALGARFAKWRAVFTITETTPSLVCIEANARRLAAYAVACQQKGIVPIIEPEVLMEGDHTIQQTQEATRLVLETTFKILKEERVNLKTMLLKPNMIVAGREQVQIEPRMVAAATIACFKQVVPAAVPGIVFLSGGESELEAITNLNAIELAATDCPWKMTYSFGRALQTSALTTWAGKPANWTAAQTAFLQQAALTSQAQQGHLFK